MKIGRTYRFEAAHYLPKVGPDHKCSRMHGHNYRVEVEVEGKVDERGFVMDFAELDEIVLPLVRLCDHQILNEVEGLNNPTAELIAVWFLYRVSRATRVRVYENDDCWAEYRPSASVPGGEREE